MNFINFNADLAHRDIFHHEGLLPAEIHPVLANSWKRSRECGINPFLQEAPEAASCFPENDRDEILLEVVRPYFNYFSKLLVVSDCVLAISNSKGVIVYLEGLANPKAGRYAEKHNFLVGANWNEKAVGASAIGTALEEKTSILFHGVEHFSYGWHPYSCAASPIYDRTSGEIIGVVNASTFKGLLSVHSMGWVAAMAHLIEAEFKKKVLDLKLVQSPKERTISCFIQDNPLKGEPVNVLGSAPSFLFSLNTARRVAGTDLNVLLAGETGTGKEVFAKYIHHKSSRSGDPFVAVNCGAIPGDLVYSELFGYSEGAFTGAARKGYPGRFEQAEGGTIFLDEVGDAPNEVQVGLLRVLEERLVYRLGSVKPVLVNVRVIAATSKDIMSLVAEGKFREDLYYRLACISIKVPALRDRKDDILLLADYFLREAAVRTGRYLNLDCGAKKALVEYDWPGNVRELKNLMDRLAALADGPEVNREALMQWGPKNIGTATTKSCPEREKLVEVINEVRGNISLAAKKLGVDRTTVYRRMKKYGIKI